MSGRAALALAAALSLSACATQTPRPAAETALSVWFDCLRTEGGAIIGAHRGGYGGALPENAVETVMATASAMPMLAELEVAGARDGLVMMHDDTLDRTTTGTGPVLAASVADVTSLRLEAPDGSVTAWSPPTLRRMLYEAGGRVVLQLDFKDGASPEAVARELAAVGLSDDVVIITYSLEQAAQVHRAMPDAMISVSIDAASEVDTLAGAGVPLNRVLAWTGTRAPRPDLWAALRARGVEPIFGTLGREGIDRQAAASGDDTVYARLVADGAAILASDRPREAYAALVAAGRDGTATRCGRPPVR